MFVDPTKNKGKGKIGAKNQTKDDSDASDEEDVATLGNLDEDELAEIKRAK